MFNPHASTTTSQLSDRALLKAVAAGDPSASERLYRQYWPDLYRTCLSVTRCPDDAFDVAQDAMLATLRRLPELDLEALNLSAYLRAAGRHRSLSCIRQRKRALPLHDDTSLQASGGDVHEQVARAEQDRHVRSAVLNLPERQRVAMLRSACGGQGPQEIGAALGLNSNATAQLLHRARRGIERQLAVAG
ncbi:MAG: sigma-70 family RNA polymerase sigma factor [Solirubrobacteraceae bacterium]|nr:sigma-70 family RNA polymerase sigma factor [Solirubrobacteraceae bacterium]